MNFKFLVNRLKGIILNPTDTWDVIHSENKTASYLKWNLLLPVILLTGVSAFLGSFLFINTGLSEIYSILSGVRYLVLFYVVIYATAFVLAETIKAIDTGRDFSISFEIIAYSAVPFLICQIVSRLFESFIFINVLALYGLYIFWTGIGKMINPPENKKIKLMIAAVLAFIVSLYVGDWILTRVVDKLYFAVFA